MCTVVDLPTSILALLFAALMFTGIHNYSLSVFKPPRGSDFKFRTANKRVTTVYKKYNTTQRGDPQSLLAFQALPWLSRHIIIVVVVVVVVVVVIITTTTIIINIIFFHIKYFDKTTIQLPLPNFIHKIALHYIKFSHKNSLPLKKRIDNLL